MDKVAATGIGRFGSIVLGFHGDMTVPNVSMKLRNFDLKANLGHRQAFGSVWRRPSSGRD